MSRKYLVLADVDGQTRALSMRSNGSQKGLQELSRQMAEKLFANHKVGSLWIEPWPADDLRPQPAASALEWSLG